MATSLEGIKSCLTARPCNHEEGTFVKSVFHVTFLEP